MTATTKASVGIKGKKDNGLYTIKKIVDHRVDKKTGTITYRTRWVNYTSKDDTFEPLSNNIASTGHVDRYIRSLQSKTLSKTLPNVADQ